jgi:hypothetical protein
VGPGKLFLCAFAADPQAGGYLRPCFDDSQVALLGLIAGIHACACVHDLNMPGLSGLATRRELRHNRVLPLACAIPSPMFDKLASRDGGVDLIDKSRRSAATLHRIGLAIHGIHRRIYCRSPDLNEAVCCAVAARGPLWYGVQESCPPLYRNGPRCGIS